MIRVSFLTPSLHTGGAERFILTLARHFQHCDATSVIQLPVAVTDEQGRVLPILRHFSDPNMERQFRQVMRIDRAKVYGEDLPLMVADACRDADVLMCWGVSDLRTYTQHLRIPVIEVSHASGEWDKQAQITETSYKGANRLYAVSEAARTAFPKELHGHVYVIYNGIDVEHVMPRRGREHQRNNWGIKEGQKVALFLGRFADVKRPELFVRAIAELPEEWVGVMVGHGPTEEATKQLAGTICSGRIAMPGLVTHAGDAFAASDVFVMTSEAEGHPLTLTEAWIAGKPAVSTPYAFLGEAAKLLGMQPCVIPESDAKGVASAIIEAEDDPMVDARRVAAVELFSASAMAARWEAHLYELVSNWDAGKVGVQMVGVGEQS